MACKLKKGETKMPEQTQTQDTQQSGAVGQAEQTQTQNTANNTQSTISNEELKKQLDIIDEKVSKHNSFVLNSFEASFDFSSEEEKDINLADGSTVPNAKKISRKVDEKIAQVDTKISQVGTKIEEFESYKLDKTLELDETKAKVETIEDILSTKANIGGNHEQAFKVSEAQLEYEATPLKQVNEKLAEIKGEIKGEIKTEIYTTLNTAQEGLSTKANVSGDQTKVFKVADAEEEKDAVNLKVLTQKISEISISGGGVGAEVLDTKANVSGDQTKVFKVANAVEDKDAVNKAQLEEVKTLAEQKALISGSETQIFKVADAEEEKDAVNLKVLNQKLTEFRGGSSIAGGSANHSEIINSFDENKPVRFAEICDEDGGYIVAITKRGDFLVGYGNVRNNFNERVGHLGLIRTTRPNVPIIKAMADRTYIFVLYEDGLLLKIDFTSSNKNFNLVSSKVDNVMYSIIPIYNRSVGNGDYRIYKSLIYTKKDENNTFMQIIQNSSGEFSSGYRFEESDPNFGRVKRYNEEYIISTNHKVEKFFYIRQHTPGAIIYYVYNKKLYFKEGNKNFILIPELAEKNIKEIKFYNRDLFVLDEDNNLYKIGKRGESFIRDKFLKTEEKHVISVFPETNHYIFYTSKKYFDYCTLSPNFSSERQSDRENYFKDIEKEDIRVDYIVPYFLKNGKKYFATCKGFLDSKLKELGYIEADREVTGAYILSDMLPNEENVLEVLKEKKINKLAYINKLGEIYAMGYIHELYPGAPSFIGSWTKLN